MANQITPNPSVPSQVVAEVKFPKFINNLGIIPTSYKDSMSYYEVLTWLCKFLEETVIPTVNENGEAVEELQNLYVELNSYVTHYFDNLDVQEEINNKLDEMAQSGALQETLSIYFRDLENTYTERYNEIEAETDARYDAILGIVNQMDNKLDTSVSGSPAGVYDTVEDLTTADPNHSKIYVVKSNGHWYYYDTTLSAWTSGGTYQSSVQSYDTTLTGNNEIPNSKSIGERINNYYYKDNYFNAEYVIDGKYYSNTGALVENENYYCTTNPIHLNEGDTLYYEYDGAGKSGQIYHLVFCDNLGNFISRENFTNHFYKAQAECYLLINFTKSQTSPDYLTKNSLSINQPALETPSSNFISLNNKIAEKNKTDIDNVTKQYNYFDYENSFINGNFAANGTYAKNPANTYFTTNLMECKSGDVFKCNYFGTTSTSYLLVQVLKYNSKKQFIERTIVNAKTYTCNFDGYLRFNCNKGATDILDGYFLISKNETVSRYYPYRKYLSVEKDYDVKITKQDDNNYIIYFGKFNLTLFKTVDDDTNSNNWNIKNISKGSDLIVPTGTDILGPVKINDDDDFIGGVHGDETTNNILISIDGSSYSLSEINELSGNSLTILMKSSVYEEGTESKAFDRYITIIISNNKIHVSNNYKASKDLTLKRATNGGLIACANPIINSIMFNNTYYSSAPTTSQDIGSRLNTEATINTIYGSVTVRNIIGHENENYDGYLHVFTNESPIRNKIYFDTYKGGSYDISSGDLIPGEFEYILS